MEQTFARDISIEEGRQGLTRGRDKPELTYQCLAYIQSGKKDNMCKVLATVPDIPEMLKKC